MPDNDDLTDLPEFKSSRDPIQNQNQEQIETNSTATSTDDLEGWTAPKLEPADAGVGDIVEDGAAPEFEPDHTGPQKMSKDIFWANFQMAFKFPGMVDPDFKPLAIQPDEKEMGHEVSTASYDLIDEHYPQLLEMNDKWFKLALIGQFLFGKALIVKSIYQAKSAPQISAPGTKDQTVNKDDFAAEKSEIADLMGVH